MRHGLSLLRTPLSVLVLMSLALSLASSGNSAPRARLRCSVAPRSLPVGGGEIRIFADAGQLPLDAVVATIIRPDRTPAIVELQPMKTGGFEGFYDVPANTGRGALKYTLQLAARGGDSVGLTVKCGVVVVKAGREKPPLVISTCDAAPRLLPSSGGDVEIETRIIGKKKGLTVVALVTGPGTELETDLVGRGGLYRGTVQLPPNTTASPQVFSVLLRATHTGASPVETDCGLVTVVPTASTAGFAVSGILRSRPVVQLYRPDSADSVGSFFAFEPQFQGGVNVAAGDLTGDGVADFVLGTTPGTPTRIQLVRGGDLEDLGSFFPFGESFTGGVYVAAGDVNGDGRAEVIAGAGTGSTGGHVKVFDGVTGAVLSSFMAHTPSFTGGVRVAVGDVNGDGHADIITGTEPGATAAGGGPHVKVFDGATLTVLRSFFPYGTSFSGGVRVATGDVNGDGRADLITGAGAGTSGGHVKVFDGNTGAEIRSFFAYGTSFTGGVNVAAGDLNGDGVTDIITGAGPGAAGGHVKVFDGSTGAEIRSFLPFDVEFTDGVSVAAWR